MADEFTNHVEQFIASFKDDMPEIFYQAFDFSHVIDSRSHLMKLTYDKSKISFLNLEMIVDMFQVFAAVHSAVEQKSSRDFSVDVPCRLSNTKSVGDALRIFGGYGKPYIVVVSIADRVQSEELFDRISQIETVTKLTREQMQQSMNDNRNHIQQYYFASASEQEKAASRDLIGEIVTKMVASKMF